MGALCVPSVETFLAGFVFSFLVGEKQQTNIVDSYSRFEHGCGVRYLYPRIYVQI